MKRKKDIEKPEIRKLTDRESDLFLALCVLTLAGIFYSTALVSICIIGIALFSLRYMSFGKFKEFFSDYRMMPFLLVFLMVFLSGGNSTNHEEWAIAVRVKLPFLVLPIAIYMLPVVDSGKILKLHYWLLATCVIVGLPILFYALMNYDEMISRIGQGQYIPAPIEHVKYSMFNAYAVMTGVILYFQGPNQANKMVQSLTAIGTIIIFILMHILAVRTGLVIFYTSIGVYGIFMSAKKGSKSLILGVLTGLIVMPIVMYHTIPTIRQKVGYVLYDRAQYKETGGANYSDSERIMSYKAGWELWKRSPVMGVGYGDIREEAHLYYDKYYERSDLFKLPHSQFLLSLSAGGVLGFLMFVSGFYTPFLNARGDTVFSVLLFFLYVNYSLSFLVENSLERSMSVAFFLIIALPLIKCTEGDQKKM